MQPEVGSQVSLVQTLPSSQSGAAPRTPAPPAQVSLVVQALASSQGDVLLAWTHPVCGSQVSSVQTFASSQEPGLFGEPAQMPLLQVSFEVQALASSQGAVLL